MLTVSVLAVALAACGSDDKKSTKKSAAPKVAMTAVDLEQAGFKATMQAPKGAKAKDSFGSVQVDAGKGFAVEISYNSFEALPKVLAGFKKNTVQKMKKVHVNTSDTLIVETKAFGRSQVFMNTEVKVGGKKVSCRSKRGAVVYTRAQADVMVAACKTLKAK